MEELVRLLRCPDCGAQIELGDVALCANGHRYRVVEGIPVFLDEATVAADPQYASQRAYFDAEFEQYERYVLENWRAAYVDRLRAAGVLEGDTPLIDIGVGGSGYTVIEAARMGRAAVGCDLSLRGLVTAREFARAEGVAERTLWVCCSAERLPFAGNAFGAALAIAVLEHVPEDHSALAELARVLHDGGRAWVTVPHDLRHISAVFRGANRRHDRRLGHLRRYDAETLVAAARKAGLEPVDIQYTGHAVKVVQVAAPWAGDRVWWWCEGRDRRRSHVERGSMQLSAVLARTGTVA
jgi:ubiquinone/menaquinone biosynthesis C-methylase UbiE